MPPAPSQVQEDRKRLHAYPRPQLQRNDWINLNGPWDFALDPEADWELPDQVVWFSGR